MADASVLDAEAALLAELPARPPREVTVRVTQPRAAEALAAPVRPSSSSNRTKRAGSSRSTRAPSRRPWRSS